MKLVIAPDKFKGCLSAVEVARAIAAGVRQAAIEAVVDLCPMADGGEGTVSALVAATGGRIVIRTVTGPLPGMRVEAPIGMLGDGETAAIEMAAASGLALIPESQRNPLQTTTYGTGELIRAAIELGASKIILGIGGSATTDGGIGCVQGFGGKVKLTSGEWHSAGDRPLVGADVERVEAVEVQGPAGIEIVVACDVGNPLYGANGAAAVFGPQKGASPKEVARLDAALRRLAERTSAEAALVPGAGAAGGLGFGLMVFFRAKLQSGVGIVIEAAKLRQRLVGADLCLTGEGRLDSQSLEGKTPVGVSRLCRELGVPCIALAGSVSIDEGLTAVARKAGLTAWFSIVDRPMSLEQSMRDAERLLRQAAANVVRTVGGGQ